jgi:DNA-binding beta-propeller fold protein YncE
MKRIRYDIKNWTGGINTKDNAFQLDRNELVETQNVRITDRGNLLKRSGNAKINSSTIESGKYVIVVYQHEDEWGNTVDYCVCGRKLYFWDSDNSQWTEVQDTFGLTKSLVDNRRASRFSFKNKVFISNGEDPAFQFGYSEVYKNQNVIVGDNKTSSSAFYLRYDEDYNFSNYAFIGGGPHGVTYTSYDLAVDNTNKFVYYIAGNDIYKTDFTGDIILTFGGTGTGNGQFTTPQGIDVDETNSRVYVTDEANDRVQYFDLDGNYVGQWGSTGTGNGEFDSPKGIAVDETNSKVYVVDVGNNRVQSFSLTGTYSAQVGSVGSGDGQFSSPDYVAVDETNSKVYVTDGGNDRIQLFSLALVYDSQFGSTGTGNGQYNDPEGIALDVANTAIYIVDRGNNRVQYTSDLAGTYAGQFGNSGQYIMVDPIGIDIMTGLNKISADAFRDLGSPPACKAVDKGAGSIEAGTYKYKLTWVVESGGSIAYESSGGVESNPVTIGASRDITLTDMGTPPGYNADVPTAEIGLNQDITHIYIYRSKLDGTWGDYYYIAKLAKSSSDSSWSTTYDDSIAAGSVGTDIVPSNNTLVPNFKYLIEFKNVLFGAGDWNNPTNLYWTNALDEHDWALTHYEPIGENEGTIITGLGRLGDYLVVFKEDSIWYINPTVALNTSDGSNGDVTVSEHQITREYGCVSGFTIDYATVEGRNGLIFADKDKGICFLAEGAIASLSDKITTDWLALNKDYLINAVGKYYEKYHEYWLAVTASGTTNNQVWCINLRNKAIYKPFALNIMSMGLVNSSGIEYLYTGDFNGFVYKQDSTEADATTAINAYATTAWLDCNYPTSRKVFDKVSLEFVEKGSWNFNIDWAVDGAAFDTTNRTLAISAAGTAGNLGKKTFRLFDIAGAAVVGEHIRFKIRNANASQPFEIGSLKLEARVYKDFIN